MAFAGSLSFNPIVDTLPLPDGTQFRFSPPVGSALPRDGYERALELYRAPPPKGTNVAVRVSQDSKRLQLIRPFGAWDGQDEQNLEMLIKVRGKCSESCSLPCSSHGCSSSQQRTTYRLQDLGIASEDTWRTYRVGPPASWATSNANLAENLLIGAINDETGVANSVRNNESGELDTVPNVAAWVTW